MVGLVFSFNIFFARVCQKGLLIKRSAVLLLLHSVSAIIAAVTL